MSNLTTLEKISIGLIIALLLCLFPMPYGYYIIVRLAVFVILGCFAYQYIKAEKVAMAVLCGAIAILFQPFIMITMEREAWQVIDVLLAIVMAVMLYRKAKKDTRQ